MSPVFSLVRDVTTKLHEKLRLGQKETQQAQQADIQDHEYSNNVRNNNTT